MTTRAIPVPGLGRVIVVGLGNIGSQFVAQVARLERVRQLVLIDPDRYERANLESQNIAPDDVGLAKPIAWARKLRRLGRTIEVEPIVADVAAVPPGRLRGDLVVTGLDSIEARLAACEPVWRWGVPLLDAGVNPEHQLVRVSGFSPGRERPCFACALDDGDYRQLAARHTCAVPRLVVTPTNGPVSLGAMAAAVLLAETEKILRGDLADSLLGRQLVIDAAHHVSLLTALRRNPQCRFDHRRWSTMPLDAGETVATLLTAVRRAFPGRARWAIQLEQRSIAIIACCLRCGHQVKAAHVVGRKWVSCPHCGGVMRSTASMLLPAIDSAAPASLRRRSLRAIGIQSGDVVRVSAGRTTRRFVIRNRESL